MLGQLINGRYEILEQLGEGVVSATYLARGRQPHDPICVVKQLTPLRSRAADDPAHQSLLESFEQEALVLRQLGEHPQIPRLLAHFTENQKLYLIREYMEGHSLREEIQAGVQQSESYVTEFLKGILEILVFVHQSEIVHRNIRPENIIRQQDQKLGLIDFGAVKELSSVTLTPEGQKFSTVVGNPGYMAPEQAKGKHYLCSDIYALGMMGIEALTGVSPSLLPEDSQTGELSWRDQVQVSDRLAAFLDKMVSDRYTQRYASALEALQGLLTQAVILSPSPSPRSPVEERSSFSSPSVESAPAVPVLQQFEFETAILLPSRQAKFAKALPEVKYSRGRTEFFAEDLGKDTVLEMVSIPGGTFFMGSPNAEKERSHTEGPQRSVTVRPFFISKFPVTQAQWRAVAALPQVNLELEQDPAQFPGLERPVEHISWHEAIEFCARLSQKTGRPYSLPSEAVWEYACRAGTNTPFYFGETITSDLVNYGADGVYGIGVKGENRYQSTSVGSFPANAFGLYDMHGNVWEWCLDHWHENYRSAPTDGSAWLTEDEKQDLAVRGGSWHSSPEHCRSASRDRCSADARNHMVGFRVVAVLA
jgi:formylglycine-generating enzyme required for sulfatase activity